MIKKLIKAIKNALPKKPDPATLEFEKIRRDRGAIWAQKKPLK